MDIVIGDSEMSKAEIDFLRRILSLLKTGKKKTAVVELELYLALYDKGVR